MRRTLIAAAFLLAGLATASAANEQLHYEPAVVRLSGILVTDYIYRPPDFGEDPETDQIERLWILKLDQPVDVIGTPDDDINSESENDVLRVGLVNFSKVKLSAHLGKRVMLEGTLFHAHTGRHHSIILLNIHKVTRLKNRRVAD